MTPICGALHPTLGKPCTKVPDHQPPHQAYIKDALHTWDDAEMTTRAARGTTNGNARGSSRNNIRPACATCNSSTGGSTRSAS